MIGKKLESELKEIVKAAFINQEETSGGMGYRYFHSVRVYDSCKGFLSFDEVKRRKPDADVALIASLFHDIGRATDKRKLTTAIMPGHDELSGRMVKTILKGHVDEDTISKVSGLLLDYKNDDHPSIEKELVTYADDLDEIGALDVWRMFTFEAYNKGNIETKLAFWRNRESKKYSQAWINNFKIRPIRKIAERRRAILSAFMEELELESKSADIRNWPLE